jgi:predicted dehydrogenase
MKTNDQTTRRTFLKTLGLATATAPFLANGLLAAPPSQRIRHASFGASGMARTDLDAIARCHNVEIVAICDVDTARMDAVKKAHPKARCYQDWRELLDKEARHIDSVNISTPDHMHAPIALATMQLGKHIYAQKPLAHNLHETRRLVTEARTRKLVTQMGIQGHAGAYFQTTVQLLKGGAIGKIKEIHCWSNKRWGDTTPLPTRTDPIPPTLNWDLWLGCATARPYLGNAYYHPGNWRRRLDFGVGTLGDMACHILDAAFDALGLTTPITITSTGDAPTPTNWPVNTKVTYLFNGTPHTATPTLPLTWHDGASAPPAAILAPHLEGRKPSNEGSLYIGTHGILYLPHTSAPQLLPTAQFTQYAKPRPKNRNHWDEFIQACRGNGKTSANFDYAGPLTETVLLGGVAQRFPNRTLRWNSRTLNFDHPEANTHVQRTYRKGWEIPA